MKLMLFPKTIVIIIIVGVLLFQDGLEFRQMVVHADEKLTKHNELTIPYNIPLLLVSKKIFVK